MKGPYLLPAASLTLLMVSLWMAFPPSLPLEAPSSLQGQTDKLTTIWTPLTLKDKEHYEKTIVKRGVIPRADVKDKLSKKTRERDIIVIGIANIEGKKSAIVNFQRAKGERKDAVVSEGEEVNGWKVVAIKEKSVVLERGREKRELEIFSPQGSERREKLIFKRLEPHGRPPIKRRPVQELNKLRKPVR